MEEDIYLDGVDLKNPENDPKAPRCVFSSKKYKGKERLCDCAVGTKQNCRDNVVLMCRNPATHVFYIGKLPFATVALVCDTCLPRMEEAYTNRIDWSKLGRAATARYKRDNK